MELLFLGISSCCVLDFEGVDVSSSWSHGTHRAFGSLVLCANCSEKENANLDKYSEKGVVVLRFLSNPVVRLRPCVEPSGLVEWVDDLHETCQ
jgi:hypothetical protein